MNNPNYTLWSKEELMFAIRENLRFFADYAITYLDPNYKERMKDTQIMAEEYAKRK